MIKNFSTYTIGTLLLLCLASFSEELSAQPQDRLPDLIVSDLEVTNIDRSPSLGRTRTISYSATNQGTAVAYNAPTGVYLSEDATLSSDDRFVQDGVLINTASPGGQSRTTGVVVIPADVAAGIYFIIVQADYPNNVVELDEDNNTAAVAIRLDAPDEDVPPPPSTPSSPFDLQVTAELIDDDQRAQAGELVQLLYVVRNNGIGRVNDPVVGFYLSEDASFDEGDILLEAEEISDLDGGESEPEAELVPLPSNVADGGYFVLVVVDRFDNISESDETNNVSALPIAIGSGELPVVGDPDEDDSPVPPTPAPSFDLQVTAAVLEENDRRARAGERVTLDYVVRNNGDDEVDDPLVGFYLSEDDSFDEDDIFLESEDLSDLDGGESESENEQVPLPENVADGDYFFLVVVDPANNIPESDESNNVNASPITIDSEAVDEPVGEAQLITQGQREGDFYRVNFSRAYTNPVVVVPTLSFNGNQPTTVRVANVDSQGFDLQIDEWDYLDGNHVVEEIPYMVFEAGVHILPDGRVLEARFTTADDAFSTINFSTSFNALPVVFSQVVTTNEARALTTRQRNVTDDGFQIRLQAQESVQEPLATETVAWIAIASEARIAEEQPYEVSRATNVNHRWFTVDLTAASPPVFLAAQQTTNDNDPATIRYRNLTDNSVQIKVEEERSADDETRHADEVVGYAVFAAGPITALNSILARAGVAPAKSPALLDQAVSPAVSNYPNPFQGQTLIHYTLPQATQVELVVYTIYGQEVARLVDTQQSAGTYTVPFVADRSLTGTLLYRLSTDRRQQVGRMLLE